MPLGQSRTMNPENKQICQKKSHPFLIHDCSPGINFSVFLGNKQTNIKASS